MIPAESKVVVVGTTADYIEMLEQRFASRVLFITDPQVRLLWQGMAPSAPNEILCDLQDSAGVLSALKEHVMRHGLTISGVVSYDCESLGLAAFIAQELGVSFPTVEAIANCRSKYRSKHIWQTHGVGCPAAELIQSEEEMFHAFDKLNQRVVMKPLSGSGGELVLSAQTKSEAMAAFKIIRDRLSIHENHRMYDDNVLCQSGDHTRSCVVMEELIDGEEYSCDFMLMQGEVTVIRLAKKLVSEASCFGTILAYELPATLPHGWTLERLNDQLKRAAQSLGLSSTLAMVDFKFFSDDIYFLELTPRLGGDCLVSLIQASAGVDMLELSLDFAQGKVIHLPPPEQWKRVVGMHLLADKAGILTMYDISAMCEDERVVECYMKRLVGDQIKIPPDDYDLRILGHVIFEPQTGRGLKDQCAELSNKFTATIE